MKTNNEILSALEAPDLTGLSADWDKADVSDVEQIRCLTDVAKSDIGSSKLPFPSNLPIKLLSPSIGRNVGAIEHGRDKPH